MGSSHTSRQGKTPELDPVEARQLLDSIDRRGIHTRIGNHTFRATGITAYLKNGGTLENAAAMANHASTRTTQLYDCHRDDISVDEVERIRV